MISKRNAIVACVLVALISGGAGTLLGTRLAARQTLSPRDEEVGVAAGDGFRTETRRIARASGTDDIDALRTGDTANGANEQMLPPQARPETLVRALGDVLADGDHGADATRLLDDAIADGVIDADERTVLGTLLSSLTLEQRRALIERLASAATDGGVSLAD